MLNPHRVLEFIKNNLGWDFQVLELSDDQILDHVKNYTLREFSQFFPYVKKKGLDLTSNENKVPNISNEWYIIDSENLEILDVKNIYFPSSEYVIHGHPPLGPLGLSELNSWALDVNIAGMVKMFSPFDKTWEFRHPNIIRISPKMGGAQWCIVEYETIQPDDFRGIPNQFQVLFCRLALADIMIRIGMIRNKYTNLRTPFGDIPISETILSEGKELRSEIISKLEASLIPNTIVEFG